jgi:RNA polymerase sigma-70 factor (ECF subfamily)
MTDAELVTEVLTGDTSQFEVLMRKYNERLYRVARSIAGEAEAEDVLQTAWLQAYANLGQYAGTVSFVIWASRIAANEANRRLRRRAKFSPMLESEPVIGVWPTLHRGPDPEHLASNKELCKILEAAIDALPGNYRPVFVLRCIEQMQVSETAQVLGLTEEVVKTRLHRARIALRRFLTDSLGELPPDLYCFRAFRCDQVVAAVGKTLEEYPANLRL